MAALSEGKPGKEEKRVVVRSVAAKAVVIGAAAIDLAVRCVRQRGLRVHPGDVVELGDPAARIGAAVRAGGDAARRWRRRSGAVWQRGDGEPVDRRVKQSSGGARGREDA